MKKDIDELYTGPHDVKLNQWVSCAPFEELLGLNIVEAENGQALLTMPFVARLAQGAGLLHGGAVITLADTAIAMAVKSRLPEGSRFGTISLTADFLAPVKKGILTAKATVEFLEDRQVKGQAQVLDEAGQTILTCSATFKLAWDVQLPESF